MSRGGTRGFGRVCLCGTFLILAACSGSSSQKESEILSEGLILSGSVGDGPVVGADIRVLDARGSIVAGAISDAGARYQLQIPDGTPLPVTLIASGGTDLVTGRALDFELSAKALESSARELNLSPYTTLANQAADCRLDQSGETRTAALAASLNNIHRTLNFGWDRAQQADPIADEITADNVAMVLLSNEALGELIRRTTAALAASATAMSADEVMRNLACDVADGRLDGAGPQVRPRVAMTALGAAIGVQLEVLAGELYVDGQDSTPLLDDALRTVQPESQLSVQDAPVVDTQLQALRAGISVMDAVSPRGEFRQLRQDLSGLTRENARARSRSALSTQTRIALTQLPEQMALASEQDIDALIERQVEVEQAAAPVVSFSADRVQLTSGQTTRLSWASSNSEYCVASEGWTGERAAEGAFQTGALTAGTTFGLDCFGPGGSVSATVVVNVTGTTPIPEPTPVPPPPVPEPTPVPSPPAQPTLSLQAAAQSVVSGSSTTLSWVSTNTTGCSASGAWSGNRNRNGTSTVGPLTSNATFNLSCTGAGGTVSDSVSVTVTPAPPPPLPSVSMSVSNGSITAGQSTTLSWASTNASSCAASGGWSGTRSTSGSLTVSPAVTTTYTLTCSGAGGSRAGSATVNVTAAPPPPPAPQPTVTLGVSNPSIVAGNATTLNWSSTNASSCTASGGWSGARSTSGSANVSPTSSTSYTLTCTGTGGSRNATVAVSVTPAPAPQITFTSADSTVSSGGTTQLSWTSMNTTSCNASGGWSGSRSLSGNQMVGPLSSTTTYTLSCSGPGGNVVRMLTVSMLGQVSLNWVAPAQNVDGSPLNDLAGFRIYYGIASRAYTDVVDIGNPNTTSFVLQQVQGDYYFAMTALDGDGNESAYSNEVRKTAQ